MYRQLTGHFQAYWQNGSNMRVLRTLRAGAFSKSRREQIFVASARDDAERAAPQTRGVSPTQISRAFGDKVRFASVTQFAKFQVFKGKMHSIRDELRTI